MLKVPVEVLGQVVGQVVEETKEQTQARGTVGNREPRPEKASMALKKGVELNLQRAYDFRQKEYLKT